MIKKITNIVILLTLISFQFASGQTLDLSNNETEDSTKFYAGISFGYMSVLNKGVKYQSEDEYCPTDISKVLGNGFYIGLNLKYSLFSEPFDYAFLNLKLQYEKMTMDYDPYEGKNPFDEINSLDLDRSISYFSADVDLSYFTISLIYSQSLSKKFPLSFIAGPSFSFLTCNNFKQVYHLYTKTTNQFPDTTIYKHVDAVAYNKEIEHINKIILGIQYGMSYEVKITDKIQLLPEISFTWHLFSVVRNYSWNMSSFNAGISFMYAID